MIVWLAIGDIAHEGRYVIGVAPDRDAAVKMCRDNREHESGTPYDYHWIQRFLVGSTRDSGLEEVTWTPISTR